MIDLDYLTKMAANEQADPPAFLLLIATYRALITPRPISEYHEDMGPVLWWAEETVKCPRCDGDGSINVHCNLPDVPCPTCAGKERVGTGRWLGEPPYVGTPNDVGQTISVSVSVGTVRDWPEANEGPNAAMTHYDVGGWPGYHTHFTPIPALKPEAAASRQGHPL